MGEPIPQSYKRHFDFPFWPVESESELADYAEWLIDLVRHESNTEPGTRFDIRVLGRDREPPLPLAEFRERFDEFPFNKIFSVSLDAWNPDESLKLEFRMETRMVGAKKATVTVNGNNKLRVQRIKTKVREEGDARIARIRKAQSKAAAEIGAVAGEIFQAEAKREQDRQQAAAPKKSSPPAKMAEPHSTSELKQSEFKRLINHPVAIGLFVTIVGSVIAALIVAAILSS